MTEYKTGDLPRTSNAAAIKKKVVGLIAEVSNDEAAVRFGEAAFGVLRPTGMTATESLNNMPDDIGRDLRRGAAAVIQYVAACISSGVQPS